MWFRRDKTRKGDCFAIKILENFRLCENTETMIRLLVGSWGWRVFFLRTAQISHCFFIVIFSSFQYFFFRRAKLFRSDIEMLFYATAKINIFLLRAFLIIRAILCNREELTIIVVTIKRLNLPKWLSRLRQFEEENNWMMNEGLL